MLLHRNLQGEGIWQVLTEKEIESVFPNTVVIEIKGLGKAIFTFRPQILF